MSSSPSESGLPRHLVAVLVLGTMLAYGPAMAAGYIWDDDYYVTNNPVLLEPGGWWRLWVPGVTPQYYPAVFTTYWLESRLWGLHPTGYHVVNVLLHATNAVLVWRLGLRLQLPWAFGIACLFAWHPVQVESVAWITERKNVLSAFGYLLAALAYLRFDARRQDAELGAWRSYAAALAWFVFALLGKTVTCSLPAALILWLLWRRQPLTIRRLAPLLPFFAIGLALALQTAWLEREHVGAAGADFAFSMADRMLIASNALLFYPGKLLWPWPIVFFYARWQIDDGDPAAYWTTLVVIAAFVATLALWRYRDRRGPFLAIAFTAGTLFPALGFFNVYPHRYSFVADHFQYLGGLGIFALLAAGGAILTRRWPGLRIAAIAMLVPLLGITFQRGFAYADAETLWRDTIAQNPSAWIAHNNLAEIESERGENEAALARLRRALSLTASVDARTQMRTSIATVLGKLGRFQDAAAELEALHAQVGGMAARVAAAIERAGRPFEAEPWYRQAATSPDEPGGALLYAWFLMRQRRPEEAVAQLEPLAAQGPDLAVHRTLMDAYAGAGQFELALAACETAIAAADAAGAIAPAAELRRSSARLRRILTER